METKKATLKVNVLTYPVLLEDTSPADSVGVKIDWAQITKLFGTTPDLKRIFNCFIGDIGFDDTYWNYPVNALNTYYVEPEWLILDEPEEDVLPLSVEEYETAKRLRIIGNRLENGFTQEGLQLVRVEHSQDMYEGTITLHYKKEEV